MSPYPIRKPPQKEKGRPLDAEDLQLMVRIAKEQAALIDELERALEANQIEEIVRIGWMICGRYDVSEPDRRDSSLNR